MKPLIPLPEDTIQAQIYKYYHNKYCNRLAENPNVIFSVPNGGYRSKSQAMLMKATGLVAGVSDLIIVRNREVLFIEVKTEIGVLSKHQEQFRDTVTALGFRYIVVRSLKEFICELER